MSVGYVVVEDADPRHPGFVLRRYAFIVVEMSASGWGWAQKDHRGTVVASGTAYGSEGEAEQDAALTLQGRWEPTPD